MRPAPTLSKEHLEELKEHLHLSASGIADYLDCGLLYKFSRVEKRQPEPSLVLG